MPSRLPRFNRTGAVAPIQLTERDDQIIRLVHRRRFLRSDQIVAFMGGSQQQILRRLRLLYHHGYLERPRAQLRYYEQGGSNKLRNNSTLGLCVRPETDAGHRNRILHQWYRQRLKKLIFPLIEEWQTALWVTVAEWGVKKMETRWGTCNIEARRIRLKLELAKKPVQCLEYIFAHESASGENQPVESE